MRGEALGIVYRTGHGDGAEGLEVAGEVAQAVEAILGIARAEQELATLRTMVEQAAGKGGEILFISQRQLLTFKQITGVPLVEPYENVFLMEMAMAGNPEYLGRFHDDLKNHRFALIERKLLLASALYSGQLPLTSDEP